MGVGNALVARRGHPMIKRQQRTAATAPIQDVRDRRGGVGIIVLGLDYNACC